MALTLYKAKRAAKATPEPFGDSKRKKKNTTNKIFVVQKHAASHLHYDFRLEVEGVLKSWAIPKGPSLNPAEKHLAIMVEDHPYDYHDFEGTIPKGSYGGGTVMVWDQGEYVPVDENGQEIGEKAFIASLKKGKISFLLSGQKLNGRFSMVRIRSDDKSAKENWLIFKASDQYATTENILDNDLSAITQRSMDEITDNGPSKKSAQKKTSSAKLAPKKKIVNSPEK